MPFDLSNVAVHPSAIRDAAEAGTRSAGETLPFVDTIQRSFGSFDVSSVAAHADVPASQAARAMGATAFARGEHVAFARAPSLHTAAHEAAHVIQHRAVGGEVGGAGDREERIADAVADRVVTGQSSEALLAGYVRAAPGAPRGANAVHLKKATAETRYSDALGAKDWKAAAAALDEMTDAAIDKHLQKESLEDRESIRVAAWKQHKRVAQRARRSINIELYRNAVADEKWAVAAHALHNLDYAEIVERVEKLSSDHLDQLKAVVKKKGYANVQKAIDALPKIRKLKSQKSKLEAITSDDSASFGEVGGATAKLKDVTHDLAVLETAKGIYEGKNLDEGVTPDTRAKATDCTEMVLEILRDTFAQQGRQADWKKVWAKTRELQKLRGGGLSGLDLQGALQSVLKWKGIFWAPDPGTLIPKQELSHANPDEAQTTFAQAQKGNYHKNDQGVKGYPGIGIAETVVNYAPERPTKDADSPTKKDTSGLAKLKKLPFGVMSAHGGDHMVIITYGTVVEVHWDERSNSVDVITQTKLENWAVGSDSGYHFFASGAIVAPAADVDKAFK